MPTPNRPRSWWLPEVGAWEAEEGGVGAWFASDDFHAEQVGVEAQRPVESATNNTAWLRRTGDTDLWGGWRLGQYL